MDDTIKAALGGETEAFEMLIHEYSSRLYAVAYAILGNCEEAEDVVQESFLKAYKARWRVRDPEKFPAWLTTIARNKARDLLRAHRRSPQRVVAEGLPEKAAGASGEGEDTDELHLRVHSILSTLPEQHRTAVTLRYLEDLDYRTIEQTMGLTNGALRGILGRALGTLRKGLKPSFTSYGH